MRFLIVMIAVLLAFSAVPCQAEFYKYRNAAGAVVFTDDLSRVPPDQRSNVTEYRESTSTAETADGIPEAGLSSGTSNSQAGTNTDTKEAEDAEKFEALKKKMAVLDARYTELLTEKKRLESIRPSNSSSDQWNAYHLQVTDLNEKIAEYEQTRDYFSKEVDAFNSR